ncbi:putative membrane protein [Streptomyces sp. SAI-090]|nr:putative membrane protein [Streptomyces sp. SAI-090]
MKSEFDGHGSPSRPGGSAPRQPAVRLPHERIQFARMRSSHDRVADAITSFAGTMRFVYLHALWFTIWIALNEGFLGKAGIFDPYPFGLLTMIVSLEAIFLSTFVMVSQNRQAARENVRADLDFETNLRSEVWSVHIGKVLGLDPQEIEEHVQEIIAQSKAGIDGTPINPKNL